MSAAPPEHLTGWGGGPGVRAEVLRPVRPEEAAARLAAAGGPVAPRGAGRAYGDAALPAPRGRALSTLRMDRLLAWDAAARELTAECGATLGDIAQAMLARGAFPPVLPGTRHVTLGGAIAADVHGKNHLAGDGWGGAFADHVAWLDLLGPDGRERRLRPGEPDFEATAGGMGLTGLVLRAALRGRPVETGWILAETRPAPDLGALMAALAAAEAEAPYAVAWLDGTARGAALGRGHVELGRHAAAGELDVAAARDPLARRAAARRPWRVPAALARLPGPGMAGAAAEAAARAFAAAVARRGRARAGRARLTPWPAFFHPLDAVADWNRVYGRPGLLQFQALVPEAGAEATLARLLEATEGRPAWLAVLKRLGEGRPGGLSFPGRGWTLALDFPATAAAEATLVRLHAIAAEAGARLYLAKDARLSRAAFEATEPRATAFRAARRATGADRAFASALSARLGL